ncbi:MAG: oligosaccharide flippase family protein [Ignavibacteria bacterium]|nr:oligosaccharide flippase family protein [Ignavibacteria bacterium]
MLKDIKHTLRQSAVYGLSRLSTKLAGFILLPFISLKLDISSYGYLVLTESLWQIFWAIFLFGLESGIVRWYTLIEDYEKRKKFLFSVFLFILLFNLFCIGLLYLFQSPLGYIIYGRLELSYLLLYAGLIALIEALSFVVFLVIRIEEKAKLYTLLAIIITLLSLTFQIYALYSFQDKLGGIFLAKFFAPLTGLVILLPYILKRIKLGFDSENLKELIKYSFPIMLASLLGTLLNQQDRYILGKLTDTSNVGIYGLAFNITGIVNFLLISPYSLAFSVISWKKLNDDNAKRFFTKNVTYVFFVMIYFSAAVALFTPHFIKIFTLRTDYWAASEYVPWILLSTPFYAIQTIGIFSFYVTKKTGYVLFCYTIAVATNFAMNILLIPLFGVYGACISIVTSFIILALSTYIFSRKNYHFRYEWIKIIMMVFTYLLLVTPFFIFRFESRMIEILLKFLALGLFPVILFLLKFYEEIEIKAFIGFVKKYSSKISSRNERDRKEN